MSFQRITNRAAICHVCTSNQARRTNSDWDAVVERDTVACDPDTETRVTEQVRWRPRPHLTDTRREECAGDAPGAGSPTTKSDQGGKSGSSTRGRARSCESAAVKWSKKTMSGRGLRSRSCPRAWISRSGSSCQVEGREGSHCRTCVFIATVICVKFTSGGSRRGTGKTVSPVVCGVRRPAKLEKIEQSLGHTGQREGAALRLVMLCSNNPARRTFSDHMLHLGGVPEMRGGQRNCVRGGVYGASVKKDLGVILEKRGRGRAAQTTR